MGSWGDSIDDARRQRLASAKGGGFCPQCEGPLGPDAVGTGNAVDGRFCGLACVATFYEPEFRRRAEELSAQHRRKSRNGRRLDG